MTLRAGAWIAGTSIVWCTGATVLAMLDVLPHWGVYANLATLVLNAEALRLTLLNQQQRRQ